MEPAAAGKESRWERQQEVLQELESELARFGNGFELRIYGYDQQLQENGLDAGHVNLPSTAKGEQTDLALEKIKLLTKSPELGEIFTGKVVRTTDFGAFVEFTPGVDGMVHISQLSNEHVRSVADAVQLGDEVMVMVTDVTPDGKVRLSRKAVVMGWTLEEAKADDQPKRSSGGNRGGDRRGGGNRRR